MINGEIQARVRRNIFSNTIDILLALKTKEEFKYLRKLGDEDFVKQDPYCYVDREVVETFHLNIKSAQELMDELWSCGLRPAAGSGSAGSLQATEKHLDDMRKIAFNRLDIEK